MYIYISTNSINGFQYVGKSRNDPYASIGRISKHKYADHNNQFHRALREHGFENFTWEVIHYPGASDEAINAIECWHISRLDTFRNGYNSTKGGEGASGLKHTLASKQRMSESTKGQKMPPRTKEHMQKISEANTGKKRTLETKQKMSESAKKAWAKLKHNPDQLTLF